MRRVRRVVGEPERALRRAASRGASGKESRASADSVRASRPVSWLGALAGGFAPLGLALSIVTLAPAAPADAPLSVGAGPARPLTVGALTSRPKAGPAQLTLPTALPRPVVPPPDTLEARTACLQQSEDLERDVALLPPGCPVLVPVAAAGVPTPVRHDVLLLAPLASSRAARGPPALLHSVRS